MQQKVLVLGRLLNPWENGILIYLEAKAQGKDVIMMDMFSDINLIKDRIKTEKIDWVIVTGLLNVSVSFLKELQEIVKIFIWDADAVNEGRDREWKSRVGIPDVIVSSTLDVVNRYRNLAKRLEWCPQYYDSEFSRYDADRLDKTNAIFDVVFLGSSAGDARRMDWLRKLRLEGLNCCFCGSNPVVYSQLEAHGRGMTAIYKQSKIVIDIKRGNFDYGDFTTSDRIFKALGSGAFYLTFEIQKLDKLFGAGKHLVTYSDYGNMIEKIKYYLGNEVEREVIAMEGHKEVSEKHLLKHRIPQYWSLIEGVKSWPFS